MGFAIAVSTALAVSPVAASSNLSTCSSQVNPYNMTSDQLAACAVVTYPLVASNVLPDGGSTKTYDTGNGSTATFNIPPATFNPSTASDGELQRYGIPSRPLATNLAALSSWDATYSNMVYNPPGDFLIQGRVAADTNSPIWSGYVATNNNSNYSFNDGEYVQPGNTVSPCGGISEGAIWTGLGGVNPGSDLAQVGTNFGSNDTLTAVNGQFWYSFYNGLTQAGGEVPLPDYAKPKDIVQASVTYNSGRSYSMFLFDTTEPPQPK